MAQNNQINEHSSSKSEHDPEFLLRISIYIKDKASFPECIDPINRHNLYFGKITGSNKRSVPINRTVSFIGNQRIADFKRFQSLCIS